MTRARSLPVLLLLASLPACLIVRHRGPMSDHFDGRRFRNPESRPPHGVLRWLLTRRPARWPRQVANPEASPPPARVDGERLVVTLVGHSTVLVQTQGLNLLTDPVWSSRVGPVRGLGPRRVRPPAVPLDRLPRIDAIVVSHAHYDHCDLPTLRRLADRDRPRILVPLGLDAYLGRAGVRGVESLDWWQGVSLSRSVRVHLVPAAHWSRRGVFDLDRTLWGGFVIEARGGSVYFAGDTAWGSHFARIGERFAPVRLALLPVGAYAPRWFMRSSHIDPDEAVRAHLALGASRSLPMHHETFQQSDEALDAPLRDLAAARTAHGVSAAAFGPSGFGQPVEIPAVGLRRASAGPRSPE